MLRHKVIRWKLLHRSGMPEELYLIVRRPEKGKLERWETG